MEQLAAILLSMLGVLFILVPAAILMFLVAVWFGLSVLAPRIARTRPRRDP